MPHEGKRGMGQDERRRGGEGEGEGKEGSGGEGMEGGEGSRISVAIWSNPDLNQPSLNLTLGADSGIHLVPSQIPLLS